MLNLPTLTAMLRAVRRARRDELQRRAGVSGGEAARRAGRHAAAPAAAATVSSSAALGGSGSDPGTAPPPRKSGVLEKKSRWLGGFSHCFFALEGTALRISELPPQLHQHQQQSTPATVAAAEAAAAAAAAAAGAACVSHTVVSVMDLPPPAGKARVEHRLEIAVRPQHGVGRLTVRCASAAEKYAWLNALRAVAKEHTRPEGAACLGSDLAEVTVDAGRPLARMMDPRAVAMMQQQQNGSHSGGVPGLVTRHIAIKESGYG
jgi:hypothetical protein